VVPEYAPVTNTFPALSVDTLLENVVDEPPSEQEITGNTRIIGKMYLLSVMLKLPEFSVGAQKDAILRMR
jgi:hypothetical protein